MNQPEPVEHDGQRILTTDQLAELYGTTSDVIKKNFGNNKNKFTEGVHYFHLEGQALRDFKNKVNDIHLVGKNANQLYLWTRRGAARHSKMLGTDQAWDMFDSLEENYFNPQARLDMSGLSPQTQAALANAQALATQERRINQVSKKVDAISYIVATSTMDWRNATRELIHRIAHVRGDDYRKTQHDIFADVDSRGAVALNIRLANLRNRLAGEGASKTKQHGTTKVDVIANDKKLIEIYMAVVKDHAIKYRVWENQY